MKMNQMAYFLTVNLSDKISCAQKQNLQATRGVRRWSIRTLSLRAQPAQQFLYLLLEQVFDMSGTRHDTRARGATLLSSTVREPG
jgi:hypothetical protein